MGTQYLVDRSLLTRYIPPSPIPSPDRPTRRSEIKQLNADPTPPMFFHPAEPEYGKPTHPQPPGITLYAQHLN